MAKIPTLESNLIASLEFAFLVTREGFHPFEPFGFDHPSLVDKVSSDLACTVVLSR